MQRGSRRRAFLASAAVLLVALGVFAVTRAATSGAVEASASPAQAPAVAPPAAAANPATPAQSAQDAAAAALLSACVARQSAAQGVVAAAKTGAGHWRDHVQGQADVDAGTRSSVEVKANTWAPTRAAGPSDVAGYDAAVTTYNGVPGCAGVESTVATGELKGKLNACAERQKTLDTYLGSAKAVMDDWRSHLMQMAQHAAGEVDGTHALDNWMAAYRNAGPNLNAYAAAEAALAAAPPCAA
ncbi:MAG: hypothetical protein WCG47_13045 [Dermatophilaceae bacterium]